MQDRKLVSVALVLLLLGAWLAVPAYAAEPEGSSSPAALSTCSANTAIFSPLSPQVSTESTPATAAVMVCGCGDAVCVGKHVNFICGAARLCQVISACSPASTTKKCGCLAPP